MKIVATTSLPAVDRSNAARSRQYITRVSSKSRPYLSHYNSLLSLIVFICHSYVFCVYLYWSICLYLILKYNKSLKILNSYKQNKDFTILFHSSLPQPFLINRLLGSNQKLLAAPTNKGLDHFPDTVKHFWASWRPCSILQVVRSRVSWTKQNLSKSGFNTQKKWIWAFPCS